MDLTDAQWRGLQATDGVASGLSLVGSAAICVLASRTEGLPPFMLLLVILSACDCVNSLRALVSLGITADSRFCGLMAFLETAWDLPPVMWTAAMSYCMWHSVFRTPVTGERGDSKRLLLVYTAVCMGFPTALAVVGWAADVYGDAGRGMCWVKDSSLRLVFFYVPLWLVLIFNLVMYTAVAVEFRKAQQRSGHELSAAVPTGSKIHRLKYYPLVLVWTWSFGTVNRIAQAAGQQVFALHLLHVGFGRLQGLWNFIVYGSDADVGAFRTRPRLEEMQQHGHEEEEPGEAARGTPSVQEGYADI